MHLDTAAEFGFNPSQCTPSQVEMLVNGVVDLLDTNDSGIDPARLRPPTLRVVVGVRHQDRVNAFLVQADTGEQIVIGAGLCPFLHLYTRAAATYFLPTTPNGSRPSEFWPAARSAVATCLEWLASPSSAPRVPEFRVTPRQARVAEILGSYAFRFAICHEMAHVVDRQDQPIATSTYPESDGHSVALLQWSRDQELAADKVGLRLQMSSLADPSQVVNGLASATYSVHATGLLDSRLMLVANLVDFTRWQAKLTHPPALLRCAMLFRSAGQMLGGEAGAGMSSLHDQLAGLDMEILGEAGGRQDQVAATTLQILDTEAGVRLGSLLETDRSLQAVQSRLVLRGTDPPPSITPRILEHFVRSPLGLLRTLDAASARRQHATRRDLVLTALAKRLVVELPFEFRHFLSLSKQNRTDAILRIIPTS
jgi:hypothetical protein